MRRLLLLALIAACDPVVAHNSDAAMADSAPDAPTHGMVRVKVYDLNDSGAVVTGVPVVFVEADDTEVGHPTTDSQGVAMADVHAGASATVVITQQDVTEMTTLFGLKPGDDIILGPTRGQATDAGSFTVTFTAYPGATQYGVFGPCGSTYVNASPAVLTMKSDCKVDSMDVMVVAYGSSGPAAYLPKTGVAFTSGGSTAVTGNYQGMSTFTANFTNIPAAVTSINYERDIPDGYGFELSANGTPTSGTYAATLNVPAGAQAIVTTNINNGMGASQTFAQAIQGGASTYGMDVGATALPWIGPPTLDLATHKVTVTVDNTGTSGDMPDVFFGQVEYSRPISGTNHSFEWIVLSAAPVDLTLPTLPPEVGDLMPKTTDTIGGGLGAMVESDAIEGYDVVRQDLYTTILSVTQPIHPAAGSKTRECLNFGNQR